MKNILYGLILFSSLIHAQATFHFGAVTSTHAKCMIDGGGGYQIKGIGATLEGSIIVAPIDQHKDHPAYFTANTGYVIKLNDSWSITPLGGAAYRMASVDEKELNGFVPEGGIRFRFRDVYMGCTRMDKTTFFSIGMGGGIIQ